MRFFDDMDGADKFMIAIIGLIVFYQIAVTLIDKL